MVRLLQAKSNAAHQRPTKQLSHVGYVICRAKSCASIPLCACEVYAPLAHAGLAKSSCTYQSCDDKPCSCLCGQQLCEIRQRVV